MKTININNKEYEIISEKEGAIDIDILKDKITEYYDDYDYIVGDWAYGKVRLKGFYESSNPKCKNINDIKNLNEYIENNCAYGCKWFQIKTKK
ncbi:MAG TPA: DUF1027 domain-containing protein [Firmicutes bacterium]|nr:DUF1027 domain-containing protein [Bacillota bacterium]